MNNKKKKYVFPALFREDKNGWFTVRFPDLDDCFTAGKGIAQSLKRAKRILELVLYDYEKRSIPVPEPTPIREIHCEENEFASYVLASTKKWWKKYKGKNRVVRYEVDFSKPLPPLTKKQQKMFKELKERPIQFDKDCPPQTEEELSQMVRVRSVDDLSVHKRIKEEQACSKKKNQATVDDPWAGLRPYLGKVDEDISFDRNQPLLSDLPKREFLDWIDPESITNPNAKAFVAELETLRRKDPEAAQQKAEDELISMGLLNPDGTPKDTIVSEE